MPRRNFARGAQNFLSSGNRAITIMPMMRGEETIGLLSVVRLVAGPLSDKQLAVLRTFANQAVIAIENTRLLKELRERTDDLSELLEQQTATSEVLQVISCIVRRAEARVRQDAGKCDAHLRRQIRHDDAVRGWRLPHRGAVQRAAGLCGYPTPQCDPPAPGKRARHRRTDPSGRSHRRYQDAGTPYIEGNPNVRALADLAGARTLVDRADAQGKRTDRLDHDLSGRRSSRSPTSRPSWSPTSPTRPSSPSRTPACSTNCASAPPNCRNPSTNCAPRRTAWCRPKSSPRSASSPPASRTRSRTRSTSSTISRRCRPS